MELTPEQITKVQNWMREYWADGGKCSICHNTNWTISTILAQALPFNRKEIKTSPQLPLVNVSCDTCGQVVFFSAILLGVVPQSEETSENIPPQEVYSQAKKPEASGTSVKE